MLRAQTGILSTDIHSFILMLHSSNTEAVVAWSAFADDKTLPIAFDHVPGGADEPASLILRRFVVPIDWC